MQTKRYDNDHGDEDDGRSKEKECTYDAIPNEAHRTQRNAIQH